MPMFAGSLINSWIQINTTVSPKTPGNKSKPFQVVFLAESKLSWLTLKNSYKQYTITTLIQKTDILESVLERVVTHM